VVLTDFGIAQVEGSSALTMTGEVIGSPEFLAPERALGRTPGPESDLWSLGVLLYAAVEGNSPFRQDTPLSTLRAIVDEELPPPYRAGPLAPVIEGLLRKDPAQRLPAERAEQELRIIGAGGTPRADAVQAGPYAPTVAAPFPQEPPTTPYRPAPTPVSTPTTDSRPPDRNRRAAAFLVAGVVVLALAIAGLTYALLNRDNGDKGGETAKDSSPAVSSPASPTKTDETREPTPSPSESRTTSAPPPQSVDVALSGTNTDYEGSCPPDRSAAPSFTATLTVGRLPATVTYRWVSKNGSVNGNWKTLTFPAGGGKTQQDRRFVTTQDDSGTFQDTISVEVREPVQKTSNSVPFSLTCVTETPTGTGEASPTASP
jgi:hypothetical protein